jgi:hypothetical protein
MLHQFASVRISSRHFVSLNSTIMVDSYLEQYFEISFSLQFASVCFSLRQFASVCVSSRQFASVRVSSRQFASVRITSRRLYLEMCFISFEFCSRKKICHHILEGNSTLSYGEIFWHDLSVCGPFLNEFRLRL